MEWLADRVPSSSLSDYFFVVSDVENYAHKKYIFSGALYDVVDPTVSGKLVVSITADKFFKFIWMGALRKNAIGLAQKTSQRLLEWLLH